MDDKKNIAFNFGENWETFSDESLDKIKFENALKSLKELIGLDNIKGKRFIDIGCGSGIFSISALRMGASEVVGIDISKESVTTSKSNSKRFDTKGKINFLHKSIFDKNNLGIFDVVYSWGVLHHTGNMWKAIDNSLKLVNNGGLFVIAIYNKHWTSPIWSGVKKFYNISPKFIQTFMVFVFYFIIAFGKFLVTFKNPFVQRRGMSFYYDIVDWIGGYPYEYASKDEIKDYVEQRGFKLIKFVKTPVPTGCNEFVFRKLK